MSKARELAELSRTVSDSADAVAITIDSSENVTFANDIDVTGTVTADGLTVDGTASTTGVLTLGNAGVANAFINSADSLYINIDSNSDQAGGNDFQIGRNSTAVASEKIFLAGENGDISFYNSAGSQSLFWDSSAESLGIGTNSPSAELSVSNGGAESYEISPATVIGGTIRQLAFNRSSSAYIPFRTQASQHEFYAGSSEAMRIDASGSVGIGTSNIYGDLHLQGGQQDIILTNTNADGVAGATIGRFISQARGYGNNGAELASIDFETNASAWFKGDIVFKTNNSDGTNPAVDASERMRIDASGNLLVGKTSSANSIDGLVLLKQSTEGGRINFTRGNNTNTHTNAAFYTYTGTAVGSITTTTTSTSYGVSSDQRLKENIADADDAGSKVDAIQVRKFDWIADGSHQDYGMVAQELQTVAPEAVSAPADPDEMMGVDYSKLVPMLVKEIQSLRSRVAQLENN